MLELLKANAENIINTHECLLKLLKVGEYIIPYNQALRLVGDNEGMLEKLERLGYIKQNIDNTVTIITMEIINEN